MGTTSTINTNNSFSKLEYKKKSGWQLFLKQIDIQTMVWPGIILMFLFSYLPMYGIIIAFKNYDIGLYTGITGIFKAPWAGLEYFIEVFNSPDFMVIIKNTLGMNFLQIIIGFPIPIIFALLVNEIANSQYKKIVQTVSYMPHFISWAIFGGLIINMLAVDGGVINAALVNSGFTKEAIAFLAEPKYFWWISIFTEIIKETGWSAIIYIAAIATLDTSMYEAANIDGAGRFQKMRYITLPSISGTIIILLIITISYMFSSGFDKIWILQNSLNIDTSETIDTYVYKMGLGQMRFSYSAAMGLMRSVISVILLSGANLLSHKITKQGLY